MNISSYLFDFPDHVSPSSLPSILWKFYIDYLWEYQNNSWVARTAYICRVFSIIVSLPIIVLALLDISSYGIARTLGVIDDVKASTSDIPSIHIQPSLTPKPESSNESERQVNASFDCGKQNNQIYPLRHTGISQPETFYASEDNNLKLSGVGVFSPAASRPPSPTISRRNIQMEGRGYGLEQEEGLRHRGKQVPQNTILLPA